MLRSEKMAYCDMFVQPEAVFPTMCQLGDMSIVQFSDMNESVPPFQRKFVSEICRCAEMERKLQYVETEIIKDKIQISYPLDLPEAMKPTEMQSCENLVNKWESDVTEIAANETQLKQNLLRLKEMRYVIETIGSILGNTNVGIKNFLERFNSGPRGDVLRRGRLFISTGVVTRKRCFPFQLMLWRVAHGNIYYQQADHDAVLEDPSSGNEIRIVAFILFCHGDMLRSRLHRVCNGFGANLYPCPNTVDQRMLELSNIQSEIEDLEDVIAKAKYYRCKSLRLVSRQWSSCMIRVRKAKAIYFNMNLFTMDITKNCLIGGCWVPLQDMKKVQGVLDRVADSVESNVPSFLVKIDTTEEPPTSQRTNKFTYGFQKLINAYGDAKYGELNPGLFTIITFPFLFAVMFGDLGHAVIMTVFAVWMLINEKEFDKQRGSEIWNIFYAGRYVILLMGMFSMVTGFIYNDIFSKAFNIGHSMWYFVGPKEHLKSDIIIDLSGLNRLSKPYPYGVDPIWTTSTNKIMIDNSMKMKLSLIIGVIHMLFGIVLSVFNHIHYKKYYAIFLQFIPEFTFLFCVFFWLVILIFYKWITYTDSHSQIQYGSSCAPQILILFIDMVLFSSTEKKAPDAGCEMYLFPGQQDVQMCLMTIAIIMVPILLLGSPIHLSVRNKRLRRKFQEKNSQFRKYLGDDEAPKANEIINLPTFGELMINQAVHTIEFVLSTISHTASYLRLWALSLAHSQLSEMLWSMILSKMGLQSYKYPAGMFMIFLAFPVWALFTVAILVLMEGLSAFLHTLRLHWVEFMSKFFIGGGYNFMPFSFTSVLAAEVKPEAICSTTVKKNLLVG